MALKYFLKDQFPIPSDEFACFIIDDPLIKKNYGFLNYKKLLSLMDQHNFCSNIAFIPFNDYRSDNEVASMFIYRPDRYLCVFTVVTTARLNFLFRNEKELNRKIKLALLEIINIKILQR